MKASSVFLSLVVAGIVMILVSTLAIALLAGSYYYVTIPIVACTELWCKVLGYVDTSWVDIFSMIALVGFILALVANTIRYFVRKKELGL